MKKTITPFTAQLVTFDTTLAIREVITRLDKQVNKSGSAQFLQHFRTVTSKAEIEQVVQNVLGENDLLYFQELSHDQWLTKYEPEGFVHPVALVYTIGNPLIAQTAMQHDIRAGYAVPLRLMILEKADGTGTNVIYHLPSSVMALTNNLELQAVVQGLDEKLEKLASSITTD
ncbi:hypothetical protein L208DRAFT_1274977 [Tricholoma matsutake]|nr:hypothetical protein L208DRAFT_1274977 [Tricholoma matsutake 945]